MECHEKTSLHDLQEDYLHGVATFRTPIGNLTTFVFGTVGQPNIRDNPWRVTIEIPVVMGFVHRLSETEMGLFLV